MFDFSPLLFPAFGPISELERRGNTGLSHVHRRHAEPAGRHVADTPTMLRVLRTKPHARAIVQRQTTSLRLLLRVVLASLLQSANVQDGAFPSRERPLPAGWTVRQGLDAFLLENGYNEAHYDASRTPARVLGIQFSVPNPPKHRWAIMRHDLHHIATGFGTDLVGEGEISAWEYGRGIRPLGWYVGAIVTTGFVMGLCIAPRLTLCAWRDSGRAPSLFHQPDREYDALLDLTIGGLREILALPPEGLAMRRRGLNELAPRR